MIPWIQVYANLPTHRKTCKLRDALGFKTNYETVGLLVCLWSWAAVNAVGGDLSDYSARDIADATGFKKTPGKLLEALTQAGFLDKTDDGALKIHDWEEHAALLMDSNEQQKKNTRERVKRYRERKRNVSSDDGCNVTRNACNAPTLPNLTLPNLTLPYQEEIYSGADGDIAGARAASESEILSIGLKPGEFYGVTVGFVEEVKVKTMTLFATYLAGAMPQIWDYRNVSRYCGNVGRSHLLDYAFEKAAIAGKAGDWRYIDGIMSKLALRDIETVAQAREWDDDRPDKEA